VVLAKAAQPDQHQNDEQKQRPGYLGNDADLEKQF
jgi:hypothetical protein